DVEDPWKIEEDTETWEDEADDDEEKDEAKEGDEADEDEGDDAGKGGDDADEPRSPIHGVWSGTAKGFSKIPGMEQDEIEFKLTIIARDDGTFTGSSESMGESQSYDSVTFDEGSGKF